MTPRVNADLSRTVIKCKKRRCRTGDYVLHRHHKAHQYLFVMAFQRKINQARYKEFVRRYFQYLDSDVVHVCSAHHREIHEEYRIIITDFLLEQNLEGLSNATWKQAGDLMQRLVTRCNQWLKRQTPGAAPWPSNGQTKRRAEEAEEFFAAVRAQQRGVPF